MRYIRSTDGAAGRVVRPKIIVIGRQNCQLTTSMPKATRGKITRRSTPLKAPNNPILKVKTILRTRSSTGRAQSKTQKSEQPAQCRTPTPPPSDPQEFIPTEVLEAGEDEEQEVKPQKGPSRAVSVSLPSQRLTSTLNSSVKTDQGA